MFLSLGSTARRANSGGLQGKAQSGPHGLGQDWSFEQRGLERSTVPDRLHLQRIQENPLQALASGKYSLSRLSEVSPGLQVQNRSASLFDGSMQMGPLHPPPSFASTGSHHNLVPGLSMSGLSTSTSPRTSLPSSSLPSSSLPTLSKDQMLSSDSGSVFCSGGEEVLSRDHTRLEQPGKRQPRSLLLAKKLKESLGDKFAYSLREKIEEVVKQDGAVGSVNWPGSSRTLEITSSPNSVSRTTWEGRPNWVAEDRPGAAASKDASKASSTPSSSSPLPNMLGGTSSLSVESEVFEERETRKGTDSHEVLPRSVSGNMEGSFECRNHSERIKWFSQRAFSLPVSGNLAYNSSPEKVSTLQHPWGPGSEAGNFPPEVQEWDSRPPKPRPLNPRLTVTRKHVFPEAAAMGICTPQNSILRQGLSNDHIARQRVADSPTTGMGKSETNFESLCNNLNMDRGGESLADLVNLSGLRACHNNVSVESGEFSSDSDNQSDLLWSSRLQMRECQGLGLLNFPPSTPSFQDIPVDCSAGSSSSVTPSVSIGDPTFLDPEARGSLLREPKHITQSVSDQDAGEPQMGAASRSQPCNFEVDLKRTRSSGGDVRGGWCDDAFRNVLSKKPRTPSGTRTPMADASVVNSDTIFVEERHSSLEQYLADLLAPEAYTTKG